MSLTANTVIFRLLLAVIVLAPLPLGANRPWAWSLLAVLTGLLLGAWALLVLSGRCRAVVSMARLQPMMVLFGIALCWAAVQTSSVTPQSWWHPLWAEAGAVLGGRERVGMVSIDPALTLVAILRLLCYGGIFWLAVQLGRDSDRAREGLVAVAVGGVAYAIYGLTVYFGGWETILWVPKWSYRGDLTATFVNRNAYGAYAGMGVLCCIGLFLEALKPARPGQVRRVGELTETVMVEGVPYLVGALVLGTALLLSHSRGAFFCTGLGVGVLMAGMVGSGMLRPRLALSLAGVIAVVGLAALVMSGDVTLKRLGEPNTQQNGDGRAEVYQLVLQAVVDAPWTGQGLGTFQPAFRMYRGTSLPDAEEWANAHSVHLETAMDLGLPAMAALYGGILLVLAGGLRGLRERRRNHIYSATALAAAALLIAHGVVDASAQTPAIAATLALLLGLGYAQSWSLRETGGHLVPTPCRLGA